MKWEMGRQDATSSLLKKKIWSKWNTDCYLLKFRAGSEIGEHLDPVEGKRHYRFNLTLWGKWNLFKGIYGNIQEAGDFHFFRPDKERHSANIIEDTMVLSIGIAI